MLHLFPTGSNVTVTIKPLGGIPSVAPECQALLGPVRRFLRYYFFFRLALERRVTPMGDVTLPPVTVGIQSWGPLCR